jgi:hypothetical protein
MSYMERCKNIQISKLKDNKRVFFDYIPSILLGIAFGLTLKFEEPFTTLEQSYDSTSTQEVSIPWDEQVNSNSVILLKTKGVNLKDFYANIHALEKTAKVEIVFPESFGYNFGRYSEAGELDMDQILTAVTQIAMFNRFLDEDKGLKRLVFVEKIELGYFESSHEEVCGQYIDSINTVVLSLTSCAISAPTHEIAHHIFNLDNTQNAGDVMQVLLDYFEQDQDLSSKDSLELIGSSEYALSPSNFEMISTTMELLINYNYEENSVEKEITISRLLSLLSAQEDIFGTTDFRDLLRRYNTLINDPGYNGLSRLEVLQNIDAEITAIETKMNTSLSMSQNPELLPQKERLEAIEANMKNQVEKATYFKYIIRFLFLLNSIRMLRTTIQDWIEIELKYRERRKQG